MREVIIKPLDHNTIKIEALLLYEKETPFKEALQALYLRHNKDGPMDLIELYELIRPIFRPYRSLKKDLYYRSPSPSSVKTDYLDL